MGARKISITVDETLLDEIRALEPANMSGWFAVAAENEVRRARLRTVLDESTDVHGAVPEDVQQEVDRHWPL